MSGKPYLKPQGHETGNHKAYIPYSTTPEMFKPWDGKLLSDTDMLMKQEKNE